MRNVRKRYTGVQALGGVDFDISAGEVHCLAGENGSGKSTLIKIISGVETPDEGTEILIDGNPIGQQDSLKAMRRGIEVIYQDLSLFPNMTVSENIALNEVIGSGSRIITKSKEREIAKSAMNRVGIELPTDELVGDLSMGDQQLVAICRALTSDIRLLIMDEPTTALTRKEVVGLFRAVEELRAQGIASLFVSHKLCEVLEIAERVTVLRDGQKVGVYPASELDDAKLSFLMTGENLEYESFVYDLGNRKPLLEVNNLSRREHFSGIDFQLFPGEILGITGLLGSGRTELAMALFGLNQPDSGEVVLDGKKVNLKSAKKAAAAGMAYVPENRLVLGLVMPQSVARNTVLTTIRGLVGRFGSVDERRFDESVDYWVKRLRIKVPNVSSPVCTLSGGNQQRVVLAKWMAASPKVLILDGPTVGIDVAAKSAIHSFLRELAATGVGIIIISDEIPEVHGNCNRILLMHRGRIRGEFLSAEITPAEIQDEIERIAQ